MRVMIVVTHLLGSGHLARARMLAEGFVAAGHAVLLASGGAAVPHLAPPPGVRLLQLPPVASDGVDFSRLLDADGRPAGPQLLAARSAALVEGLRGFAPDALITELYPFGRRILRAEFGALLTAAAACDPPPRIFASVRDILAPPSKPARVAETEAALAAHYDAVLVHSDPDQLPLEASWPVGPALARHLRYTGFIGAPAPTAAVEPDPRAVIVSAGGSDVGGPVFEAALGAAALDPRGAEGHWRILVGGGRAEAECTRLRALATALPGVAQRVRIEPARPDFRALLLGAGASVSLCGYNTALDLLATGTPGVFIPFDAGGETEQRTRAAHLARRPQFEMLPSAELSAERLVAAVSRVMAAGRFAPASAGLDGVARSVATVEAMLREPADAG